MALLVDWEILERLIMYWMLRHHISGCDLCGSSGSVENRIQHTRWYTTAYRMASRCVCNFNSLSKYSLCQGKWTVRAASRVPRGTQGRSAASQSTTVQNANSMMKNLLSAPRPQTHFVAATSYLLGLPLPQQSAARTPQRLSLSLPLPQQLARGTPRRLRVERTEVSEHW